MELKLITSSAEKVKWLNRFIAHYSGGIANVNLDVICSDLCKFFVLENNGNQVGYIRLTNYTDIFAKYTNSNVWHICEAYVKKCYRSRGYLRYMIEECVASHDACSLRIETTRLQKYCDYYYSLGFTYAYTVDDELSLAFQSKIQSAAEQRNADYRAANEGQYQNAA